MHIEFNTMKISSDIWDKIQQGVFVIAEAGKNFIQTEEERSVQEYLDNAKELVDKAIEGGADAIKFQTHIVHDEVLNIDFTSPHFTQKGSDRYSWVSRNTRATPFNEFWKPLKQYCDEKSIIFMSTPMSRAAALMLNELDVQVWKIGSGDILDFVMLDFVRSAGKPIIFSTGMSTLEEADKALAFVKEKNDRVCILHCVSKYPCPPEELRLGTISFYKQHFNVPIGFSDHSIGIEPDVVAVAAGATVIEKHFSIARDLYGADHKVSMTPEELIALTKAIRELEHDQQKREEVLASDYAKAALSQTEKILQADEAVFRPLFRKALMAGCDISAGTVITGEMLYSMRPQIYAGGLPSEEYVNVMGKTTTKDLKQFDPITWDVLQ